MGSTKFPVLWRELAALLATGCDVEPIEPAPAASACSNAQRGCACGSWRCQVLSFLLGQNQRGRRPLLRAWELGSGAGESLEAWGWLRRPLDEPSSGCGSPEFSTVTHHSEQVHWQVNSLVDPTPEIKR